MTAESDILVKGGKPWFSWAILAGVAVLAASGAGVYFTVRAGQVDVTTRLATNEAAVARGNEALTNVADEVRGLRYDLNTLSSILTDRWSNTDQKFFGQAMQLFWSEFKRRNPLLDVPPWPDPRKVSDESGGK